MTENSKATDDLKEVVKEMFGKKAVIKLFISTRGNKRIEISGKKGLLETLEETEPSEPKDDFEGIASAMLHKLIYHT